MKFTIAAVSLVAALISVAIAQEAERNAPITVNADNFVRAETDLYFASGVKDAGGVGRFAHHRQPTDIANQTVIRMNRDTLYSAAVLDLDAGPATITMPDAGQRYMALQVINEDQYTTDVTYDGGPHELTRDGVGTRYVLAAVRTLVNPNDPADLDAVHALQDAIRIDQPGGPGAFSAPNWDLDSQTVTRKALLELGEQIPDSKGMFGTKDEVDPVRHLIGSATAWGGNPKEAAMYLNYTPDKNDGTTVYKLDVPKDVPVAGFWSVSRYNKDGYYAPNDLNAYSLNNVTAKKNADGSVSVQFGGCDKATPNCLPIEAGWNYIVRLYRPGQEILDGSWKFPEAQPVS